jgi:hypothetical protein
LPSIRTIAIYLAVIGMELCCLFAVLQVANQTVNNRLAPAGLLTILILSFVVFKILCHLIQFKRLATMLGWIIFWPLVTLCTIKFQLFWQTPVRDTVWLKSIPLAFSKILTSFEPALLIIICTVLLWWLGERLAAKKLDFPATISEFQFGLIVLVLIYSLAYVLEPDIHTALPATLIFFFCGLVGISISHDTVHGWFNTPGQWHWSVMLIFSIGLILLAGLVVSIIISPEFIQILIQALKWLWVTFEKFMQWLASLFPSSSLTEQSIPGMEIPGGVIPEKTHEFHIPDWLISGFKIGWSIMIVSLILLAIWRISSQILAWMRRITGSSSGETESLKVNFWLDWINWLKRLFSSLFRNKLRDEYFNNQDITSEASAIRRIYAQWLRRMASAGYPRRKEQTPLEYQAGAEGLLVGQKEAVRAITCEYIQVRYGGSTPSLQEIEGMKNQWSILRKTNLKRRARDKKNRE